MDSINFEKYENEFKLIREELNKKAKYCDFIIKVVANYFNVEESALTKPSKENRFKRRIAMYICYIEEINLSTIRRKFNNDVPAAWTYDSLMYMKEHQIKEDEKFRQEVCNLKEILKKSKEKTNGEF